MLRMKGDNTVDDYDGFYVSYNPDPNPVPGELMDTIINIAFVLGGPENRAEPETALIKDGQFYILNGDHRAAYKELASKGYQACEDYFVSNIDQKSEWSNVPLKRIN